MPGRIDWPQNATNIIPWTLDLSTLNAVAQPPSLAGAEGEIPSLAFDVRRCRGYALQVNPGTVVGANCVIELQWSLDGKNYISLGAAYQLAIPAGAPSAANGYIVLNPFYQWVRASTIATATSGTANLFLALRS